MSNASVAKKIQARSERRKARKLPVEGSEPQTAPDEPEPESDEGEDGSDEETE